MLAKLSADERETSSKAVPSLERPANHTSI
jgi:hypothetical protein